MKKLLVIIIFCTTHVCFAQKATDTTSVGKNKFEPSAQSVVKSLEIKPTITDSTSKKISKKYQSTEESVKDIYKKEILFKRTKETTETIWLVSRITLGVSSLAMAGMGVYHTNLAEDKLLGQRSLHKEYVDLPNGTPTEQFASIKNEYNSLETEIDDHITKASIYYGMSFFLTAGFLVTFAF